MAGLENLDTTPLYMRGYGLGGTRLWFRILARLFRTTKGAFQTSSVDEHCYIECVCGEGLSAMSESVYWCPKCHRGYTNVFETYTYPVWMYRLAKYAIKPMDEKVRQELNKYYKAQGVDRRA